MKSKAFLSLLFLMLTVDDGSAQTQRRVAPKPKASPTAAATATEAERDAKIKQLQAEIEELKRQLNKKQEIPPLKPVVTTPTSSLELEAGLVFTSGDVKPVVRATFYLLKDSAETLIRTPENFKLYNQDKLDRGYSTSYDPTFDKWNFRQAIAYLEGDFTPTYKQVALKVLNDNTVATATTGFDGKAVFQNVPPGTYYLFGIYELGRQKAIWNVPVTVKEGSNRLFVDNHNAM